MHKAPAKRTSALEGIAVPGRFGAMKGPAGVTFAVRHPLSMASVMARAGQGGATHAALEGHDARWAGPDQYLVLAEGLPEGALHRDLKAKLQGLASVVEQSHGRVVIRIAGPKSRAVLAKGTPIDLHPDEFPAGKSALTQMAHVGVHLTCVAEETYDLSVFRGFAESFWEWITEQAAEFGYQVV